LLSYICYHIFSHFIIFSNLFFSALTDVNSLHSIQPQQAQAQAQAQALAQNQTTAPQAPSPSPQPSLAVPVQQAQLPTTQQHMLLAQGLQAQGQMAQMVQSGTYPGF
jgi:hypothetical protein